MEDLKNQLKLNLEPHIESLDRKFKQQEIDLKDISLFLPQIGSQYESDTHSQKLLFVGRSANEFYDLKQGTVSAGFKTWMNESCPIHDRIGKKCDASSKGIYSFEKSSFWQVVRHISSRMRTKESDDLAGSSSVIAWSNLYKLGTTKGLGTPNAKLKCVQLDEAKAMFVAEIEVLRPDAIVMLTGLEGWAAPFLDGISKSNPPVGTRQMGIEAVGLIRGVKTIVIPHPQGKSGRTECIKAVVDKIKN